MKRNHYMQISCILLKIMRKLYSLHYFSGKCDIMLAGLKR